MTDDASDSRTRRPTDDQGGQTREPLEQIADRTSERVQPDDPYTEPPDSTVDDWLGQRVERDAERLDAEQLDAEQLDADRPEADEPDGGGSGAGQTSAGAP